MKFKKETLLAGSLGKKLPDLEILLVMAHHLWRRPAESLTEGTNASWLEWGQLCLPGSLCFCA